MLLEFACSNVRSIRDEVALSLRANADDTFEKHLINAGGERVNPACAIYGSNATGKTSVLTGIALMQNMVTTSHMLQPGALLPYEPHRLSQEKPTAYSMEFIWIKTRYQYRFSYDARHVLKESLFYGPNGMMVAISSATATKFG